MPLKNGFAWQLNRVKEYGAQSIQLFAGNPRSWASPAVRPAEIEERRALMAGHSIRPLVFHTAYMVNLAASKKDFYQKSVRLVKDCLQYAALHQAPYVVLHTGNHGGEGVEAGLNRIIKAVSEELYPWPAGTLLLFENTAGGGNHLGGKFRELGYLLDALREYPVGVCFDTAHAWAAGYDLSGGEEVRDVLAEFDREAGLAKVKVVHANDISASLGSGLDRHQHIGKGRIGLNGFGAFLSADWEENMPVILETPDIGSPQDKENLDAIKNCLAGVASFD